MDGDCDREFADQDEDVLGLGDDEDEETVPPAPAAAASSAGRIVDPFRARTMPENLERKLLVTDSLYRLPVAGHRRSVA